VVSDASTLTALLLEFHDREGRDHLPWRQERTPYRVWVSEMMLQQTGVSTVIPYYLRFMERFPTLDQLAATPLEVVLSHWQGLGYYRRARYLHQTAQIVMEQFGGQLPAQHKTLLTLPGIGQNTAAAILSIGFDEPATIFDGNVRRVIARLFALEQERSIRQHAEQLTSHERPRAYAQAIMDLGATVCTPRQPHCPRCPWVAHCRAHATGTELRYPSPSPTMIKPRLEQASLVLIRPDQCMLLLQRPEDGLLAGLWEPVATSMEVQLPEDRPSALRRQLEHLGLRAGTIIAAPAPVRHTFTHFHLTAWPHSAPWQAGTPRLQHHVAARWVSPEEIPAIPIATLHRKILRQALATWPVPDGFPDDS
jgi:A/G-specific adenine glycosylase